MIAVEFIFVHSLNEEMSLSSTSLTYKSNGHNWRAQFHYTLKS